MIITSGSADKSIYFYIVGDASHASPGDPITGLLFSDIETGGSASYVRQGAARVDLTSFMPDFIWSISMIMPDNINTRKIMMLDPLLFFK